MRIALALALLLPLAAACAEGDASSSPVVSEPLQYPTFEIFRSSRMFDVFVGDPAAIDLADLAGQTAGMGDLFGQSEIAIDGPTSLDEGEHVSAELLPRLPLDERSGYWLVPVVLMALEPLWASENLSVEQVEQARHAATILGQIAGAPDPAFAVGDAAGNRAGLEAFVRWFQETVSQPERLASMIITMDDGPFAGLPYETSDVLPAEGVIALGEVGELHFARTDRAEEPWVMQHTRNGELEWSRVISGLPGGEVFHAEFYEDTSAESLGAYGWHVPFWVDWSMGTEQAHLYLDADGRPLFYYLSW